LQRRVQFFVLLAAAALAGCSGDVPLLGGGPPAAATATTAALAGETTPDTPGFNPFATGPETMLKHREVIENPTIADIMKTGGLPEMALGRPDAPVTIVQYASLTCPYCRRFQTESFPVLKREYIDTGKVRYVLRAERQIFRAVREVHGPAGILGEPGSAARSHLQGGGAGGDDARAV
jgi:protein-disulfide isomerase